MSKKENSPDRSRNQVDEDEIAMLDFLSHLTFAKLGLILEAEDPLHLPPYKGSTFRGAFGHAFRRITCVTKRADCATCIARSSCLYVQVFETPVPEGVSFTGSEAPHPFVLEPPLDRRETFDPGSLLSFHLILIGKAAIGYLPYFIYTFDELGKLGIGKSKGKFRLKEVRDVLSADRVLYDGDQELLQGHPVCFDSAQDMGSAPPSGEYVTIRFLTPARMKSHGKLVTPETFTFRVFISQLHNRLFNLTLFHGGKAGLDRRWKEEVEPLIDEVQVAERDLHWYEWERYSGRQETRMKMGGIMETVAFQGNIAPLWSLVRMGEVLHVGKASSFGLGQYVIEA